MKRAHLATVVAVAATLLLAGCSASGSADSDLGGGSVVEPAPDQGDGALDAGRDTAGEEAGGLSSTVESRDVVTTGTMSVTADDPVRAAAQTTVLVTAAEGRIDSQNQQPGTDAQPARASLVIRVPSARYEAVVADIQKLGGVTHYSTEATDVTQQKQDIDARISALETSTKRLESLMADADSTADLIEIENALSGRQAELDSLTTQRDYLEDQVAFSTLSVDFTAPGVVSPGSPRTFWDGFLTGWNALVAFLAGALVVIGAFLPWLLLLGAIAAIVLLIVRASRRTPRDPRPENGQAVPAAPAPEPAPAAEPDPVDTRA